MKKLDILSEKEWIETYPIDYKKIIGELYITELEYRTIMASLIYNDLYQLGRKLVKRKNELYKNTDEYLFKMGKNNRGQPLNEPSSVGN